MKKIILILFAICLSSVAFSQQKELLPNGCYRSTSSSGKVQYIYDSNGNMVCSGGRVELLYIQEYGRILYYCYRSTSTSGEVQYIYDSNGKMICSGGSVELLYVELLGEMRICFRSTSGKSQYIYDSKGRMICSGYKVDLLPNGNYRSTSSSGHQYIYDSYGKMIL
jgi:hypothetical protein